MNQVDQSAVIGYTRQQDRAISKLVRGHTYPELTGRNDLKTPPPFWADLS